jgi:hypothetical protein
MTFRRKDGSLPEFDESEAQLDDLDDNFDVDAADNRPVESVLNHSSCAQVPKL